MFYTVGETAKKLNISASALRYYDKEGLLPFVERTNGGIRMFKDSDFEWLSVIECLKKTGMSIKDIKTFIDWCSEGDSTIEKRLNLINSQRENVINEIKQLNETLEMLEFKKWYYETSLQAGTCSIHDNEKIQDIPEEHRLAYQRAKEYFYTSENN